MEVLSITKISSPIFMDSFIPLTTDDDHCIFSYHRKYLSSISFIIKCNHTVCFWIDCIENVKDDKLRIKFKDKFEKAFHEALKEFMLKKFSKGGMTQ